MVIIDEPYFQIYTEKLHCSLSIGIKDEFDLLTACMNKFPAMTRDSLFAKRIFLSDLIADKHGFRPIDPTIAATTISTLVR